MEDASQKICNFVAAPGFCSFEKFYLLTLIVWTGREWGLAGWHWDKGKKSEY